ncbi:hypothetical protein [Oceanobacillus jeddahense]|uniref:hypothetical protein n=1 Tax=Oceanobacillus jeddahense TaxID=1462527 RepID=UPI000596285E|nr:hypothetical protein [Oceanobacillus jeddahense]
MINDDSTMEEKWSECELHYITYTHIFLYFLTDYFYEYFFYDKSVSVAEEEQMEKKLLISLSSLEKLHYHFFQQKELLEELDYYSNESALEHEDSSREYFKEDIREQILELKRQIQQHPFSLDTYKKHCLENLNLLLSYYPKVTIINNAFPHAPWLSRQVSEENL